MATTAHIAKPVPKRVDIKQVVVATDFSSASQRAFAYAVAMARQYDAELALVHAIPPEPRETASLGPLPHELDLNRLEAERAMEQIAEEAHVTRFRHQIVIERGSVGNALCSVTQHEGADLLVLGTHGRGGLKKLALGSVAEEVLRLASCPVLTVGPNAILPSADGVQFQTILFATDFGPACAKAFRYALSFAEDCRAKIILLHIVDPVRTINVGPEPLDMGVPAERTCGIASRNARGKC